MDYIETVKSLLAKKVDVSNLTEDSVLSDLGLDSLDLVEIMLDVEETLKIEFSSEELTSLKTLRDVLALIKKKLEEKK